MDISVIIPVYNVEQYLKKCLDSVLAQSIKNYEIILVDDGSTDSSGYICDQYASTDDRITVIHKHNGGLSDARNIGYEASVGDYIFFLDSDDWIEQNALEMLFDTAKKYGADIVISNFFYAYDDHFEIACSISETSVLNREQAMSELIREKMFQSFAWGKLFKRDLLIGVPFPVGKLYEDIYWAHIIFDKISKAVFIPESLCNYYQRPDSITHYNFIKTLDRLDAYIARMNYLKNNGWIHLLSMVEEKISEGTVVAYYSLLRFGKISDAMRVRKRLVNNAKYLLENPSSQYATSSRYKDVKFFAKHPEMYCVKYFLLRVKNR